MPLPSRTASSSRPPKTLSFTRLPHSCRCLGYIRSRRCQAGCRCRPCRQRGCPRSCNNRCRCHRHFADLQLRHANEPAPESPVMLRRRSPRTHPHAAAAARLVEPSAPEYLVVTGVAEHAMSLSGPPFLLLAVARGYAVFPRFSAASSIRSLRSSRPWTTPPKTCLRR
jgi:hypothetical protein